MPDPAPKQSPYAWFITTRRGLLTLVAMLASLAIVAAFAVPMVRGRMDPTMGSTALGAALFGFYFVAFKAIDSLTKDNGGSSSEGTPPS